MDERELIRRAQQGDREAFGQLVALYQARLRAYVARYVPRADEVFDIVQDGFIDALEHLDRFDADKEVGPWLRAICRNRMLNHFRSHRVRQNAAQALVVCQVAMLAGGVEIRRRWRDLRRYLEHHRLRWNHQRQIHRQHLGRNLHRQHQNP